MVRDFRPIDSGWPYRAVASDAAGGFCREVRAVV
jgi:hypothetical protein